MPTPFQPLEPEELALLIQRPSFQAIEQTEILNSFAGGLTNGESSLYLLRAEMKVRGVAIAERLVLDEAERKLRNQHDAEILANRDLDEPPEVVIPWKGAPQPQPATTGESTDEEAGPEPATILTAAQQPTAELGAEDDEARVTGLTKVENEEYEEEEEYDGD